MRYTVCLAIALTACQITLPVGNPPGGALDGGGIADDAGTARADGGAPRTDGGGERADGGTTRVADGGRPANDGGPSADAGTRDGGGRPDCAAATEAAPILSMPLHLTDMKIDGEHVYWTASGQTSTTGWFPGVVARTPKTGGASTTIGNTQHYPESLAFNDASIFWIESERQIVWSIPKATTATASPFASAPIGSALFPIMELAADNTYLYLAGISDSASRNGKVHKMPLQTGAAVQVASGLDGPRNLRAASDGLYFSNQNSYGGSPGILRVRREAWTAEAIVTARRGYSFALDATSLYAADDTGALFRIPKEGGAATPLELRPALGGGLEVDEARIYSTRCDCVLMSEGGCAGWGARYLTRHSKTTGESAGEVRISDRCDYVVSIAADAACVYVGMSRYENQQYQALVVRAPK